MAPSVYEPLPAKAACASPTATKTLEVDKGYFASPALASCGGIVGFAYVAGQGNIRFQALDTSGKPIDDPLAVGGVANTSVPRVSIATNRKSFMVCWSNWDVPSNIWCGAVDPDTRTVTLGQAIPGSTVEVAWGVGGYMVVYRDAQTDAMKAHRVADDASFIGDPVDLGATSMRNPDVTAQAGNFTYASKGLFGVIDGMTLQPTEAPNMASGVDGDFVHVAATSKTTALVHAYGRPQASVVAAGTMQTSPPVDLGTTLAATLHPDVTAADGSFAAVWGAGSVLQYRGFDEAAAVLGDSEIDLFDDGQNFSGVAIAATTEGFVVVGCHLQSFSVAHVACP